MIRLRKMNDYLITGWDINSSNLCIISIFRGWKISMDWKDGTFFFYLYIIIPVTHQIVKFLSLLNFAYPDCLIFRLCFLFFSLSLFVLLEKRVSIFLFLRSIFLLSKCYFLFFLRAKMQMFLIIRKMWKRKGYNIWNTMYLLVTALYSIVQILYKIVRNR